MGVSGFRRAAFIVGDGNFFSGLDVTDCMDGFAFCLAIPAVVSIWETIMVDEADGRVDSTNDRVRAARQSVRLDNTTKWVLARKVVVMGKKLSLFDF